MKMLPKKALNLRQVLLNLLVLVLFFFDLSERIDHRGMILVVKETPDVLKGKICVFSSEIHRQLSRIRIHTVLLMGE